MDIDNSSNTAISTASATILDNVGSYELHWGSNDLKIICPHGVMTNPKIESGLKWTRKSLEWDQRTRTRRTVFKQELAYNKSKLPDGRYQYQTFQGMLDKVRTILEKQKQTYHIYDHRIPLDQKPQLHLMHGFRFDQRELITNALIQERSGLVGAPTRYGKTVLITNTINAYPNTKIAVLAPGVDLLPQLVDAIKKYCPDRDVKGIFSGSKDRTESDDVTVCSLDSMHKLDKASYSLVLIDEPHSAVTDSRAPQLIEFSKARLIGFGATLEGRWSGNDIMIEGIIGPVLSETTYTKCVEMGALCPIHVYMLRLPYKALGYKQRNAAYNKYVFQNPQFHKVVGELCNNVLPDDYQTLVFINNEKEAKALHPHIDGGYLAMDKLFKNKSERQEMFKKLKANEIRRCICSSIYSTGVTIDDIKAEINCDAGGGGILSIQKPGRLAEIKPGKPEGIMLDFLFECRNPEGHTDAPGAIDLSVQKDSYNRLEAYIKKGYIVDIFESIEDLKQRLWEIHNINKDSNEEK